MLTTTPKDKIEAIIKTHSYRGMKVIRCKNNRFIKRSSEMYTIISINDLPQVIMEYVNDNYNMVFCSSNKIDFYEYTPIGVDTNESDFMI